MNWASLFETLMIVCFGLSWPLSIVRTLRTKSTKGKALSSWLLSPSAMSAASSPS